MVKIGGMFDTVIVDVLWSNGEQTLEPLYHFTPSWHLIANYMSSHKHLLSHEVYSVLQQWTKGAQDVSPTWDIRSSDDNGCVPFVLSTILPFVSYGYVKASLKLPIDVSSIKIFIEKLGWIMKRVPFRNCQNSHISTLIALTEVKSFKKRKIYIIIYPNHLSGLMVSKEFRTVYLVDSLLTDESGLSFHDVTSENLKYIFGRCGRPKKIYEISHH